MATKIEWKIIVSYPNYEVSNTGFIRNIKTGLILKPIVHKNAGHLYFFPKKGKRLYIHRAVLQAFVGKCPHEQECRHLDGNSQNNNLDNLKWGTRKQNAQDVIRHGRKHFGENAPFSTMSNSDAVKVRSMAKMGLSSREIARKYSVSHTTIQKIIRGERYVR